MASCHLKKITLSTFDDVLSRYAAAVPEKLHDLDALRYTTIPTAAAKRKNDLHLIKDEVEKLVEWKLKHGTFRPKLLSLVQSNDSDVVQKTTISAYKLLPDTAKALKSLTSLKGVGPATASLLLSAAAPNTVPFFSDELFRWCAWDEPGSPNGWQRKIKYNAKEYEMVLAKVNELVERLNVKAVDAEKVAWVLGKEGVDLDLGDEEEVSESNVVKADAEGEVAETKALKQKSKAGTKRKASEAKSPAEGTRKSTRTKK
ncbi:hypothetical protein DE146DRAFT_758811 [Phaeosphaeria sp. MPI-PUGE-AT-0046c]|nr:hypothetical protein DE146DRAFT_758811 [Phaeosphaeria sp. MPI-PUGE-AT-0046c]